LGSTGSLVLLFSVAADSGRDPAAVPELSSAAIRLASSAAPGLGPSDAPGLGG